MTAVLTVSLLLISLLPMACRERMHSTVTADAAIQVAAPPSPQTYALGSAVNVDGAVPVDAAGETFRRGGEIFLSVNVASATGDQKIAVEWSDATGRVVRRDERDVPRERNYVPFSSGPTDLWAAGENHAVVIIDGRRVTELPFQLTS